MKDLTDRQRFALRESLCDVIDQYSKKWPSPWNVEAVAYMRKVLKTTKVGKVTPERYLQLVGLVELLGEWPVGYRGQGGWEKVEL